MNEHGDAACPERHRRQRDERPSRRAKDAGTERRREQRNEQREVAVVQPPRIAEVDVGLWHVAIVTGQG